MNKINNKWLAIFLGLTVWAGNSEAKSSCKKSACVEVVPQVAIKTTNGIAAVALSAGNYVYVTGKKALELVEDLAITSFDAGTDALVFHGDAVDTLLSDYLAQPNPSDIVLNSEKMVLNVAEYLSNTANKTTFDLVNIGLRPIKWVTPECTYWVSDHIGYFLKAVQNTIQVGIDLVNGSAKTVTGVAGKVTGKGVSTVGKATSFVGRVLSIGGRLENPLSAGVELVGDGITSQGEKLEDGSSRMTRKGILKIKNAK